MKTANMFGETKTVSLREHKSVVYAKSCEAVSYIQAGQLQLVTVDNVVVASNEERYLGYELEDKPENAQLEELFDFVSDHRFDYDEMFKSEEDLSYVAESDFGTITYKLFDLPRVYIKAKPVTREKFFADNFKQEDPFKDLWSIKSRDSFGCELKHTYDLEEKLDIILDFFSKNPEQDKYVKDYLEGTHTRTAGLSRVVYLSNSLDVVYKSVNLSRCDHQSFKELLCFFTKENPLHIPVVSAFKDEGSLILVMPKLIEVKDDSNQKNFKSRLEYLNRTITRKGFYFIDNGDLVLYDGVMMYRGSMNWMYTDTGIPIFFDLGECLFESYYSVSWQKPYGGELPKGTFDVLKV